MPRLFISYCREDGDDGLVADFVTDLTDELARRSGWPKEDLVYLDTNVQVGREWSSELIAALGSCGAFMPLYSPRLFQSDYCGKEWAVFARRMLDQFAAKPFPGLIIPVLWEAQDDIAEIPSVAQAVQFDDNEANVEYVRRGLRQIVRLKGSFRAEYWATVSWLARRVISAVRHWRLEQATTVTTIADAVSAFDLGDSARVVACRQEPASGPVHAHFVVVAGTSAEVMTKRKRIEGYGARPDDWRPFLPDAGDPVALYAQMVAGQQHIVAHLSAAAGDIQELIDQAERDNRLVILLVDPWSALLPIYRNLLSRYDRILSLNTGVVVAWNGGDAETVSNRDMLWDGLRGTMRNSHRARPTVYRDSPETLEDFRAELNALLVEVQNLVFTNGEVARPARSAQVIRRPNISGVGGIDV